MKTNLLSTKNFILSVLFLFCFGQSMAQVDTYVVPDIIEVVDNNTYMPGMTLPQVFLDVHIQSPDEASESPVTMYINIDCASLNITADFMLWSPTYWVTSNGANATLDSVQFDDDNMTLRAVINLWPNPDIGIITEGLVSIDIITQAKNGNEECVYHIKQEGTVVDSVSLFPTQLVLSPNTVFADFTITPGAGGFPLPWDLDIPLVGRSSDPVDDWLTFSSGTYSISYPGTFMVNQGIQVINPPSGAKTKSISLSLNNLDDPTNNGDCKVQVIFTKESFMICPVIIVVISPTSYYVSVDIMEPEIFDYLGDDAYYTDPECGPTGEEEGLMSNSSGPVTDASTKAIQQNTDDVFRVYPNPAANFLQINYSMSEGESIELTTIHDLAGRVIFQDDSKELLKKIAVDKITPGTYFLSIRSNLGRKTIKVQIIR